MLYSDFLFFCSISIILLFFFFFFFFFQAEDGIRDGHVTGVQTCALPISRFSTNTFPSWQLAQPFGTIAHNGEINTVRGNRNWMQARESQLDSELLASPVPTTSDSLDRLCPIVPPGASDSASFNAVLEIGRAAGRSLPQAMLMMIPEARSEERRVGKELR